MVILFYFKKYKYSKLYSLKTVSHTILVVMFKSFFIFLLVKNYILICLMKTKNA